VDKRSASTISPAADAMPDALLRVRIGQRSYSGPVPPS
jgi:hypothetical protein